MNREQLFAAFFFAVFLFLLSQFYAVIGGFLGPLSWAALLVLVFHPLQDWLESSLGGRAGTAAGLLTTGVILVVMVPTIVLTGFLVRETIDFVQSLQTAYDNGELQQWVVRLRDTSIGSLWIRWSPQLDEWHIDLPGMAVKAGNAVSGVLVEQAGQIAANVVRFIANFFLTTFALFFFFRDGQRMVDGFRDLLPMEPKHKDTVLLRFYETLSAVVQGTLVTAIAQGLLAWIGYWLFGVPFALLLGAATALASLIPFGTFVIWIGVVIYLLIDAAYGRALGVALWSAILVGGIDNVIRPLIIGGRTQIPTIFLFFGILGGIQAYGFLGMFLGPVLIATLFAFIRIYQEEYVGKGEGRGENGELRMEN